jgi:isoleucyl-tRNA synthetase
VTLSAPTELYAFLKPYQAALPAVFIVSQVELKDTDSKELTVDVQPPLGEKCARCWLVLESVGTNDEHPQLCDRCAAAIAEPDC